MIETSQDIVSCYPSNSYITDVGIHVLMVLWDEGQIMKVINLKKQPKKSRFYSLVQFTKPHERPWKRKHSSHCFVSQHFFTWGWDQISINFNLQWKEESDFLYAVAKQAGQKFLSNLVENRSLLSSMTAKICIKMLMKTSVNHFPL